MDEAIKSLHLDNEVFLRTLRHFSQSENVEIGKKTWRLLGDTMKIITQLFLDAKITDDSAQDDVHFISSLDEEQYEIQKNIFCRPCNALFPLSEDHFMGHLKAKHPRIEPLPITFIDLVQNGNSQDAISREMNDFMIPTSLRRRFTSNILNLVIRCVKEFDPTLKVFPCGSSAYGFGGSKTNYNILIDTRDSSKSSHELLQAFSQHFITTQEHFSFTRPVKMDSNRVQKQQLRLTHKASRIECYLIFDNDDREVKAAKLICDVFALKPIGRRLVAYIKSWQSVMNGFALQSGYTTFQFNTYMISVLVIFYLQTNYGLPTINDVPDLLPNEHTAKALVDDLKYFERIVNGFFEFYSIGYESNNHLISTRTGFLQKRQQTDQPNNISDNKQRVNDAMNVNQGDWEDCSMIVEDLVSNGLNVMAEVTIDEAFRFQEMCKLFSSIQTRSRAKRPLSPSANMPARKLSRGNASNANTNCDLIRPNENDLISVDNTPIRTIFFMNHKENSDDLFLSFGAISSCFKSFGHVEWINILDGNKGFVQFKPNGCGSAKAVLKKPSHFIRSRSSNGFYLKVKAAYPWHQPDYIPTPPDQSNRLHILNAFDDGCLHAIFMNMSLMDLTKMANVCVRFRHHAKIAFNSIFNGEVKIDYKSEFNKRPEVFESMLRAFGSLINSIEIRLHVVDDDPKKIIQLIHKHIRFNLKKLSLMSYVFNESERHHLDLIFANLKALILYDCFFDKSGKGLPYCGKLKYLELEATEVNIVQIFPRLKEVRLLGNQHIDCKSISEFFALNPTIRKLNYKEREIDSEVIGAIGNHLLKLEELEIKISTVIDSDAFSSWNRLRSLKALKIQFKRGSIGWLMKILSELEIPIESLEIDGGKMDDEAISCLCKIKQIKNLALIRIEHLKNEHFIKFDKELPQLKTLHLMEILLNDTLQYHKMQTRFSLSNCNVPSISKY